MSSSEDKNVTIISIGFLTNLAELLNSPADDISPLTGSSLVSAKVKELVVMGGKYPSGWEFNFGGSDPVSARQVVESWPRDVPITYSGFELGDDIFSGQQLKDLAPADSPVLAAYQWYVGRCSTIRESWDPVTTLYGILGLEGSKELCGQKLFAYANKNGYNTVSATDGSNAWVNSTDVTNQHWLQLADGVTNTTVSWVLNRLYAHDPSDKTCSTYKTRDFSGLNGLCRGKDSIGTCHS